MSQCMKFTFIDPIIPFTCPRCKEEQMSTTDLDIEKKYDCNNCDKEKLEKENKKEKEC